MLKQLCSYSIAVEESIRRNDLRYLFLTASASCCRANAVWRRTANEVVMTLSASARSSPAPHLVHYLHDQKLVRALLDNLQAQSTALLGERAPAADADDEAELADLADSCHMLLCIVRDSSERTELLLQDLQQARGYPFLETLLLSLETRALSSRAPTAAPALRAARSLAHYVGAFATHGPPSPPLVMRSPYHLNGFQLTADKGPGVPLRIYSYSQYFIICSSAADRSSAAVPHPRPYARTDEHVLFYDQCTRRHLLLLDRISVPRARRSHLVLVLVFLLVLVLVPHVFALSL